MIVVEQDAKLFTDMGVLVKGTGGKPQMVIEIKKTLMSTDVLS